MAVKGRKMALRIRISIGVLLFIVLSAGLFYLYKRGSEISKMTPLNSQEVISGVYAIKDNTYIDFYIVKSGDSFIAIDSGENQNKVEGELRKLNLDPLKVEAVFLTHTDSDHVGGLGLFSNARVYISIDEEQMINGKTARALIFKNNLPVRYSLLADNQNVEVSDTKVHCLLTPGHTPGSMSYVVNDIYLFSGDTLSLKNGEVDVFNEFFNMDTNEQKSSITKISKLPNVRYIFTAHYGYSDNYQASFARWNGN
jgi:hydroxyacylglutathione hydrolase